MHLDRRFKLQLAFFAIVTLVSGTIMAAFVLHVPSRFFGIGEYRVTVNLPVAAGLYKNANVTYRGTEVGRVQDMDLTPTGVNAVLALDSDRKIPADVAVQVHSTNAVGEQYIELIPRSGNGPALKNTDVIPVDRTTVPPDINALLTATNRGLQAIPNDNLRTAIDEAYTAVGGLGPELSRIVDGTTKLAADARSNLDSLTTLIDQSKPVLDTQTDSAGSIQRWAANVANITGQLHDHDGDLRGVLNNGPGAVAEARALLDRVRPTVPVLLSNLVSVADVAVTYQPNLEQLLVLLPPGIEVLQGAGLANRHTKQAYKGFFLSFNLNLNLPPPCTTGYLPATQQRPPAAVDYPDRIAGDLYCRVPADSMLAVRGARNLPCETHPGKRAPTVKMCESDENYVPLNDGFNWKGDPNATLTGQAIPQPPPGTPGSTAIPPPAPPIAVAEYDPASGTYIGPDGKQYTQANLARDAKPPTWQELMTPAKGADGGH
ncbi:MCE family protein [Mycolicibacterium phocaicum]|uniref:Mammalian cell entry protein n=1 Tax=Mycolicibacterium phocaicum TaxID=319706 RepID=A0A7I7ZWQ4_9MYCO|nr:MlaD family protein [Mycolicibacterium phocaicum]TLH58324.1 mammalian cell entry protein [Mycolicibacterium phocaicum]BBZ58149.1 mammalian cell entry protein [Mycolicibacterium phocaicum]